ncbi:MAG: hypothetical protein ACOYL5_19925 [Phototrophicaceae bacterium]
MIRLWQWLSPIPTVNPQNPMLAVVNARFKGGVWRPFWQTASLSLIATLICLGVFEWQRGIIRDNFGLTVFVVYLLAYPLDFYAVVIATNSHRQWHEWELVRLTLLPINAVLEALRWGAWRQTLALTGFQFGMRLGLVAWAAVVFVREFRILSMRPSEIEVALLLVIGFLPLAIGYVGDVLWRARMPVHVGVSASIGRLWLQGAKAPILLVVCWVLQLVIWGVCTAVIMAIVSLILLQLFVATIELGFMDSDIPNLLLYLYICTWILVAMILLPISHRVVIAAIPGRVIGREPLPQWYAHD